MNNLIETERLYLRAFNVGDAEHLYYLNLDKAVLKYTGDKPFQSIAHAKSFLEHYTHYQTYGFGRWAVISKKTDTFLGWCGLKYTPELKEYDLGFRFFKSHWGKGLATESAKACLLYGLQTIGITEILGRAMRANKASIAVLEKIGMVYDRPFDFDGQEGVIYKSVGELLNPRFSR